MAATTTVRVPHLGGIIAGYCATGDVRDPAKPTVILINSVGTTSSLFNLQFENSDLTSSANLLAIEPLGHGATACVSEQFTTWDSAIMALQVMTALGVEKAFVLGTSQGAWISARMALLAPDRIRGLVLLGTAMHGESSNSDDEQAWDMRGNLVPFYESWCSRFPTPEFVPDEAWRRMVIDVGFPGPAPEAFSSFWHETLKSVYSGNDGRKKLRMTMACLLERDSILLRLRDIKCPVHWLQSTEDPVFDKTVPKEQIKLFTGAPEALLTLVEGGGHYLNVTNPAEVAEALLKMVKNYK